ncbi:MAG: 8-amino-7-oxononanoate synthase [Pirellulaceae bacterium]|nr:8-amino-7-oxononanoate synthase [Pirellulaceae bacterium]
MKPNEEFYESSPLAWIRRDLEKLEKNTLRRYLQCCQANNKPGRLLLEGKEYINFSANDYLGLATNKTIQKVLYAQAKKITSWGRGASPLVTGRTEEHASLEQTLAEWKKQQAALLFTTGYAANIGTIGALVGKEDFVYSDEKNHASIIDGVRLSGAQAVVYRHLDMDDLAKKLQKTKGQGSRRLIVTDTLFSMNGDIAPLEEIVTLAEQYGCMTMVDEAHATGVFGKTGSGLCEEAGLSGKIDIQLGTLSKGLGSLGGFVAGDQVLIDYLANRARSYVFSTALPPAVALAGTLAVEEIKRHPYWGEELLNKARWLRETLSKMGWDTGSSCSQIIPLIVKKAAVAVDISERLKNLGIWVPAIRPPSVASEESLLRVSLSLAHQQDDLMTLVEGLRQLKVV